MSDLKSRIGERQTPTTFGNGIKVSPRRQPGTKLGTDPHLHASVTPPKSLLSRIGLADPTSDMAHTSFNPSRNTAKSWGAEEDQHAYGAPNSALAIVPWTDSDTLQTNRHTREAVNSAAQTSVVGDKEKATGASVFHGDNLPDNKDMTTHVTSGPTKEHTYPSNSPKIVLCSTASTANPASPKTAEGTPLRPASCIYMSSAPLSILSNLQWKPNQPQAPSVEAHPLRDTLLPVVTENARRRLGFSDLEESDKVHDRLREALTDEFCESLAEKVRTITLQMQALRSGGTSSVGRGEDQLAATQTSGTWSGMQSDTRSLPAQTPPRPKLTLVAPTLANNNLDIVAIPTRPASASLLEPPRAPRAMRLGQQLSQNSLLNSRNLTSFDHSRSPSGSQSTVPDQAERSGRSVWPGDSDIYARTTSLRSSFSSHNPEPVGIPIPMDPSFFATPYVDPDVEQGEIISPSKRRRSTSLSPIRALSRSPVRRRSPLRPTGNRRYGSRPPSPERHGSASPKRRRSPTPQHRSRHRHSPSRGPYSPPSKRRRTSPFPPLRHRSTSRSRHAASRRPHSPAPRRRASSPPPLRLTPIHLRSITRPARSPSINSRSPLNRGYKPRAPSPQPRWPPSPSPPSQRGRLRSSSSMSTSPPRVIYRHRLSLPPNENHPKLQQLKVLHPKLERSPSLLLPSPQPLSAMPSHQDDAHEPTPILSDDITRPQTPEVPFSRPPFAPAPQQPVPSIQASMPIPSLKRKQPQMPVDTLEIKREPDLDVYEASLHLPHVPEPEPCEPAVIPPSPTPTFEEPLEPAAATPALASAPDEPPEPISLLHSLKPEPQEPPRPTLPCHSVPGQWFAKPGHGDSHVADCEFELDAETAEKWNLSGYFLTRDASAISLSLQLLCLQKTVYDAMSLASAITEDTTKGLSGVPTEWPTQGSLIVQMNPGTRHGRTWFPTNMGPTSPPLDLTGSLVQGSNVVRFIQLGDMADKMFVLCATPAPPKKTPRNGAMQLWNLAPFDLTLGTPEAWRAVTIEVT